MRHRRPQVFKLTCALTGLLLTGTGVVAAASAPRVEGTIAREGQKVEIRHVYLFRGPDPDGDETKIIRRLVFSPVDLGKVLRACQDMNCTSKFLFEPGGLGLVVDLLEGDWPRYMAQLPGFGMSGGIPPENALEFPTDGPKHVAGTLRLDLAEFAGPTGELEFDVQLTREFQTAR